MPDDFVLNVKQIAQYPAAKSVAPKNGDVLLLQQNGAGGAYASLDPRVLFATALNQGGSLVLAPGEVIAWNGAALTWQSGSFMFSENVQMPSLVANSIFVGTNPVATQAWVEAMFAALAQQGIVTSFNGRVGRVLLQSDDILRAGGVLATNPHFAGVVTAPTLWNFNDASNSVATTAWVQGAILNAGTVGAIVRSFNGRGGCVVLNADDITAALTVPGVYGMANTPPSGDTSRRIATTMFVDDAMAGLKTSIESDLTDIANALDQKYAPLDSPQLTGIPTAPTAAQTVNSGQLATTAFVHAAVTASTTGVSSFNGRTGAVTLTLADVTTAGGAPLAAPAFTGNATAPTPTPGDNTTRIATTAFVEAALAGVAIGVASFNTRTGAVTLQAADVTAVGGALLASPALSGTPTAPTPLPSVNNTQIATTAYVTAAIAAMPAPVSSFNGRTGAVSFQASDISAVGGALLAGPAFTGVPTAPTAIPGTSNTQLATTAFVQAAVAAAVSGVSSFNGRTGAVTLVGGDVTGAGGALLAGPAFTGVPTAPTAAPGTNSTQLATTAFVTAAIAAGGGVSSFNGRVGAVTFQASDVSAVGGALLASPAFTGNPTAPTPSPGDNTTRIATTAFVTAAIAAGGGVTSFNGRAGAVTLALADIRSASGQRVTGVATASPTTPVAGDLWLNTTTNQLEVYNGTAWQVPAAGAATPTYAVQQFLTAGANSFTTPPDSTTATVYRLRMVAGGGGGGGDGTGATNAASGGGSGEYKELIVTGRAANENWTLTVGNGGAAGTAAGGTGGNGTATSLVISGNTIACNPGTGGATNGGVGGLGGTGGATPALTGLTLITAISGQNGSMGTVATSSGGSTPLGNGGVVAGNVNVGTPGTGNGSGATGAFAAGNAGAAGRPGAVIIERIQG